VGRLSETPTFLLVHGAGSGPWAFEGWEGHAPDLHAGLNVAAASMLNYEAVVTSAAALLPRPVCVAGWSMGGLAAMMAARRIEPDALVLLEPSPPGEVQGFDGGLVPEEGTYDPEEAYGAFPPGVRARAESRLARSERRRGVLVPVLECPTLVVYGDEYATERGRPVAARYGTEELYLPGASHWDLVLAAESRQAVAAWARSASASST
jgi:pimeloyl-ACP methyl ester carboxylesterase